VREVGFTALFGFKYSVRPHTPAQKLPDDVPEAVKSERLARLFEVIEAQQLAHLTGLIGTRQQVLLERPSRTGGRVEGRTVRNEIVHVDTAGRPPADLVGALIDVTILRANKHSLEASAPESGFASRLTKDDAGAPAPKRKLTLISEAAS
jgi:tRNA-2-methylthio-N6-dimethylallyladenosine synthase